MVKSAEYEKPPAGAGDLWDQLGWVLLKLFVGAVYAAVLLAWWAALFPMLSLPIAAVVAVWLWQGWPYGAAAAVAVVSGWAVWWAWWPKTWRRWVWGRMRSRFLSWWRYRSGWKKLTAIHGLTKVLNDAVLTPALVKIDIGDVADELLVKLCGGQTVQDWARQTDALRHAFKAVGVRVRHVQSGYVRLEVIHKDILTEAIPLPRIASTRCDLNALTIGMTEMGQPWRIRLLGNQVLVAGMMGSGKGSVVWSLIAALGPAIRDGSVVLWVIDPKGGAEFGYARRWFARFAFDNGAQALAILKDAAELVQARGVLHMDRLQRHLTPTPAEPLVLVVIDEAASLTAYYSDRKIKDAISRYLGIVLTQSRAMAMPVVGCVQDVRKEVMDLRQLYSYRIGLRLSESTEPTMLFGLTGRERGALCDEIPETTPGVGYVEHETSTDIGRVRAFWVTDDDIQWIIDTYPPAPRGDGLDGSGKPLID
ncbi:cell division protein FtsK [Nocardia arizonensis]|uniref:cell division protein FtsK n=1 Tax=Nocardia arizonensis TaxID=1141647 RepID=UPI000B0C9585|nr:cell division protein FtsK [Nocardia arizonensis]